jgi:hypothetical protein
LIVALLVAGSERASADICAEQVGILLEDPRVTKFRADQKERAKGFLQDYAGSQPSGLFKRLPTGLPARLVKGYEAIFQLLRSRQRFFELLQVLEASAYKRALAELGREVDPKNDAQVLYKHVLAVLAEKEQQHGFKPAIDLEDKAYTQEEWMAMLANGAPFNDTVFLDRYDSGHGLLSHRVQWYAVMLEKERNPAAFTNDDDPSYKDIKVVDLFKELGNAAGMTKLDWKDTGYYIPADPVFHMWMPLFDAFESDFTSPEFVHAQNLVWVPYMGQP